MQNETMIQFFHWYLPEDMLWKQVKDSAAYLKEIGIGNVWLPPPFKADSGGTSVGYDVYDLYDLGEFDQKGTIRTKYGTKEELVAAVHALKENGIKVTVDIVVNHKAGGDEVEKVMAYKVDENDRTLGISEPFEIEAFTKFTFPGRAGKYSDFTWNFQCFSGVDFDNKSGETAIYKFISEYGNEWEEMVTDEKGNYDYLMYADIDFRNQPLRDELVNWGKWLHHELQFDAVRLDAVKHISPRFYNEWLDRLRLELGKDFFAVGEYWAPGQLPLLEKYLDATEGRMSLFDASLHHNLHLASKSGSDYDLSSIFNNSLVAASPALAVTLTDNHDTQPLQALEAPVEKWFKPLAYALILLRQDGYPCVFYPDLFGCSYWDKGADGTDQEIFLDKIEELETMLKIRRDNAYGLQRDYFDHPNCVGWTREGNELEGCAVLLSNADNGVKAMEMGIRYAGRKFRDALSKQEQEVLIDEAGWGEFYCAAGSVSVWIMVD
jgi:alpha-amylase